MSRETQPGFGKADFLEQDTPEEAERLKAFKQAVMALTLLGDAETRRQQIEFLMREHQLTDRQKEVWLKENEASEKGLERLMREAAKRNETLLSTRTSEGVEPPQEVMSEQEAAERAAEAKDILERAEREEKEAVKRKLEEAWEESQKLKREGKLPGQRHPVVNFSAEEHAAILKQIKEERASKQQRQQRKPPGLGDRLRRLFMGK
jgi:hypothetical protein